jgi:predicted ester cyclase
MTVQHAPGSAIEPEPDDLLSRESAIEIVEQLADAKSRQLVDRAMGIYHPDGVLLCPPFRARAHGAAELRRSLSGFFAMMPDYSVTLTGYGMDGTTLCAWGTIAMTLAHTFTGDTPNGQRVETPVFILFRFRDGKVVWESFHFDLADVARQSGVSTTSLEVAR